MLWATLAAPGPMMAQVTGTSKAPTTLPRSSPGSPAEAVGRLVDQLKQHPARPRPTPDRFTIYLMDATSGDVTPIADEPAPGLIRCGSPAWSNDGRRILFDATPGTQFTLSRLQSIELRPGGASVTDFGAGNCPSFSPADDRIAFLSNADGARNGVWLMKADGSERRPLGEYGIPRWSPEGGQMMIVGFGDVRQVTLMDVDPEKSGVLKLPDLVIYSVPSWAGRGLIAAVIGVTEGDRIALIDVSNPAQARVKEVLWRKTDGPDVNPTYPIYSAASRRCVFVGGRGEGMSLYSLQPGKGLPAKRLGKPGDRKLIVNLTFSPDGRYVLYSDNGPG